MPRTTRKMICSRAEAALGYLDMMDAALMDIQQLAAGRQPVLDEFLVPLLEMHELLRKQWWAFRKRL